MVFYSRFENLGIYYFHVCVAVIPSCLYKIKNPLVEMFDMSFYQRIIHTYLVLLIQLI